MEIEKNIINKDFSFFDIGDDEIRVIGGNEATENIHPDQGQELERPHFGQEPEPYRNKRWMWFVGLLLAVAAILVMIYLNRKPETEPDEPGLLENPDTLKVKIPDAEPIVKFGDYSDTTGQSYVQTLDTIINDVPLTIFIPHNAKPELYIGIPDYRDNNIILALHAADIRRDNKKIVGAFVLKGEPLAWGLSKKGYCAILGDSITVGVADNSPLFEQATETGGYFFRQFPLVDNGQLVENEPKNKSIRRALCERAGEIFVAQTNSQESFHDFAQALVDLGCNNAIYLIGGESYGFFRDYDGKCTEFHNRRNQKYRFENFILWKKVTQERQSQLKDKRL